MHDIIPEQVDSWGVGRDNNADANAFKLQKANTRHNNKQRKLMDTHNCWDCSYFNTERCTPSNHCFHQLRMRGLI